MEKEAIWPGPEGLIPALLKVASNASWRSVCGKGVLSTRDAAICEESGADAIVVSHHHGRLPFAVPPAMILPDIRKVSGKMKVFADCSVDDGRDAYKLMALGADAVSTGRAILPGLLKEGHLLSEKKYGR